jgi:uncharacterized protein
MLESTFQHIPGVGEKTERRLWEKGCTRWGSLLESDFSLPADVHRRLKAGALESIGRLEALDHAYFRDRLPRKLAWRAFNAFRAHACYIDIETTGLSPGYAHVTTVCVHGPYGTKSYVRGRNLEELADDLEGYKYIVSFNGARFDLPFLERGMGLKFRQIHLDLLHPLKALGFRGGLKAIERELGISRGSAGVGGLDAVYLWHAYRSGRPVEVAGKKVAGEDALEMLVAYNRDDTVNLERLAELTVAMMKKRSGGLTGGLGEPQ